MHFLEYKNILNALATCIIITTGIVVCVHKSPCSHGFAHKEMLAALPVAGQLCDILKGRENMRTSLLKPSLLPVLHVM